MFDITPDNKHLTNAMIISITQMKTKLYLLVKIFIKFVKALLLDDQLCDEILDSGNNSDIQKQFLCKVGITE